MFRSRHPLRAPSPNDRSAPELTIAVAFAGWMDAAATRCDGCSVTVDLSQRRTADAVVFHIPTTPVPIPFRKTPGSSGLPGHGRARATTRSSKMRSSCGSST
jgi:hypothetical protein